ncbi:MAG: acetoacetate--CoA ligase [Gammaproteobacteria bacterium]|nr:acetoacetate--CoA ligase [Gammaproteobacteria bacterium]
MPDQNVSSEKAPVWTPSVQQVEASRMRQFQVYIEQRFNQSFSDYASLHRWSVECPDLFWQAVADFCGMHFDTESTEVLVHKDQMPGAKWFPGATLNFAANLLRYGDDQPAIVFRDERGRRHELTYKALNEQVAQVAAGLRQAGVAAGDRVAGLVPNCPETVIAMLAATSLGAIWSSCSPDFGTTAVLDRFEQIQPKIMFAADGYYYGGQFIDVMPVIKALSESLDGLKQVVVFPFAASEVSEISGISKATSWHEFLIPSDVITYEARAFDDPVYIMYSSGTTGVPKCIVHGSGVLLQHLKEHQLHANLGREDRLFFFTTCGWMMWNWLVSGLASGATIVLYDGSPFEPGPDALWRVAEEERVTIFGAGAKYYAALEQSTFIPRDHCDLSALHTIQSTGSPLAPATFDFIYESVKPEVALQSISGGTDLLGCFALGNPTAAVYRGELQCIGLGMDVAIYSDAGVPLAAEHKGELVCRQPFPSMPVGFWNDPDGVRYHKAYFERFECVWTHGDFAELTSHGGLIIHGRSDATLNPGGVRIGTAEIYRPVEQVAAVVDCVACAQKWQGDTRVILFVVLKGGAALDAALESRICSLIREQASPRHVPAMIVQVKDIPRTRNGKIAELAVTAAINGEPVDNQVAFNNPESLVEFSTFFARMANSRSTDDL